MNATFLARRPLAWLLLATLPAALSPLPAAAVELRGQIVDAASGQPLPARLYIRAADGGWHVARSAASAGSAVEYRKQRDAASVEVHTTLSPHPFVADLPPGTYTLTAERGKEYLPVTRRIELADGGTEVTLRLQRWIDMGSHGWYSGETHVHRGLDELPNVVLAEDLNVALPLTYWVTRAYTAPAQGDKNSPAVKPALIEVDATHVIYPMNTEYEIFTVDGKRHTLGAVFALNHKSVFDRGVPPVAPIARQVHAEGGLLELDKHNWPWSMMLVPVMNVDLYELTNNHIWRTEFFFRRFGVAPPEYMRIEQDERGMTERGWTDFTFQNYYALLNCGFRMRPTAGTASGVHPVPLGYGRVYVHLPDGFSYDGWMQGLDAGHSFVSTGPLLAVQFNERPPGTVFRHAADEPHEVHVTGWAHSARPLLAIEIVAAGEVVKAITPANRKAAAETFRTELDETIRLDRSSWLIVRCFEKGDGDRVRFAHTAPIHVELAGKPLRPRRAEVEYLIRCIRDELDRHAKVLPEAALAEYHTALAAYEKLRQQSR